MTYVTVPRASRLLTYHQRVSACCLGDVIKGDIIFKKVSKPPSPEFSPGVLRSVPPYYIYLFFNSNNVTVVISQCLQGDRG